MMSALVQSAAVDLARTYAVAGRRTVLGLTGPPGAGKSTLAAAIVEALGNLCVVVPMDGFHLADVELDRLGLRGRKGAPETFDAYGYAALLARLSRQQEPVVYAPTFDRVLEQPVAGGIAVPRDVPLVVTEGNYLLLADEPWLSARSHLHEVWWCDVDAEVRRGRLVRRHVQFGKSPAAASAWVDAVDGPNERLVESVASSADRVVRLD